MRNNIDYRETLKETKKGSDFDKKHPLIPTKAFIDEEFLTQKTWVNLTKRQDCGLIKIKLLHLKNLMTQKDTIAL